MSYAVNDWENIGDDCHGGDMYRLKIAGGYVLRVVGKDFNLATFVPDGRHQWAVPVKPEATQETSEDGD